MINTVPHTDVNHDSAREPWVLIPANDYARAVRFYNTLFGGGLVLRTIHGPAGMAFLPDGQGAIYPSSASNPLPQGIIGYLNVGTAMHTILERVRQAGGRVVMPAVQLGRYLGEMALFVDSEGNQIGLYGRAEDLIDRAG
jgi:uncharacterized protein